MKYLNFDNIVFQNERFPLSAFSDTNSTSQNARTANWTRVLPIGTVTCHYGQLDYSTQYSCEMPVECAYLACISLSNSLMNIAVILITGYFWLWIKEVAPNPLTRNDPAHDFYKIDVKVNFL